MLSTGSLPPFTLNLDAGTNAVTITADGAGNTDIFVNQLMTGAPADVVPVGTPIAITGSGGNDTYTVNYSSGDPIPGGLSVDTTAGGAAQPTLVVEGVVTGTGAAPNFTLSSSTASGTGVVVSNASVDDTINLSGVANLNLFPGTDTGTDTGTLNVASGSFAFNQDLGVAGNGVDVSVQSGATVAFGVTQHLDSLNVASGAVVDMVPAGGQVLDVNTLTDSGAIDLANNDLIVNTPGTAADTIEEAVAAGVTGSATEGIIYSSTAADDPGMTLGVATANQVSGSLSTLDSQSIPSTAVVARYTLQGDVNLDGTVNIQDFNIVSHNYGHSVGTTPPEWAEGDINYDGTINIEDFNLLGAQYGSSTNAVESSVAAGSAFTLDLPTPPSGTAVRWDINWGDGNNNSYAGNASSASHVYTTAGLFQVQFSAVIDTADDGGTGGPDTVYTGQSQTVVATTTGVAATPLSLTAASATDLYAITSDLDNDTVITLNGTQVEDVPTDSILSLSITGDAAEVSINFADGDPISVGGLYSDAAELELEGPHGSDPVMTTGTTAIVGSDQITYSPSTELVDNLNAAGGLIAVKGTAIVSLPFDGSTAQPVTVLPGAGVIVNGSTTVSALTIDPGGTLRMTGSGASLLTTGTLDLEAPDAAGDNGGILDLCDNDMIARQTPESVIDGLLASGFDDGVWDAAENGGIDSDATPAGGPLPAAITSSAAANDPTATHALGYQQVGSDSDQWSSATFDGVSVTDGDTVVKYTVYGDANLDGIVDSADQSLVESGYAGGLTGWSDGSFTYNGVTTEFDEALLTGIGFTTSLFDGVTTPPTTAPAPAFTPNGSITGGTVDNGSGVSINSNGVQGDISVTTGAKITDQSGNSNGNGIVTTFNRTDGGTAVGTCRWIRLITVTATDAAGNPVTGTYTPKPVGD